MHTKDLQAELSIMMLELEQAIDAGMPYSKIKEIYNAIKQLQYKVIIADLETNSVKSESTDIVIE